MEKKIKESELTPDQVKSYHQMYLDIKAGIGIYARLPDWRKAVLLLLLFILLSRYIEDLE